MSWYESVYYLLLATVPYKQMQKVLTTIHNHRLRIPPVFINVIHTRTHSES